MPLAEFTAKVINLIEAQPDLIEAQPDLIEAQPDLIEAQPGAHGR